MGPQTSLKRDIQAMRQSATFGTYGRMRCTYSMILTAGVRAGGVQRAANDCSLLCTLYTLLLRPLCTQPAMTCSARMLAVRHVAGRTSRQSTRSVFAIVWPSHTCYRCTYCTIYDHLFFPMRHAPNFLLQLGNLIIKYLGHFFLPLLPLMPHGSS